MEIPPRLLFTISAYMILNTIYILTMSTLLYNKFKHKRPNPKSKNQSKPNKVTIIDDLHEYLKEQDQI